MHLLGFQKRFIKSATAPGIRVAALSLPRGNGKSTLAAHLAKRALTPGDTLFEPGTESHVVAASLHQGRRTIFRQLLTMLPEGDEYKYADSQNQAYIEHKPTRTRLSVLPANPKTGQGLVGCPLVLADEPGAWQTNQGEDLYDALETAIGKPGSSMRVIFTGTLAPSTEGWWHDLVNDGSFGSQHVTHLQGDRRKWSNLNEVRRVNPLMYAFPESRQVLRGELAKALRDSRLMARFLSYRLNLPTVSDTAMLLRVEDWERMTARPVPPREGRPIVGLDMGKDRSWSAGAAVWLNGRVEATAVAPGLPSIEDQEKRDKVARGTYARLVERGVLAVAEGRRVVPADMIVGRIREWQPQAIFSDRFRATDVLDAQPSCPVVARAQRYSEAAADIRGLRELALDGPLAVDKISRPLLQHSLSQARVEPDTSGNERLVKRTDRQEARDDVAAALVLAGGAAARARRQAPTGSVVVVR